MPDERGAAFSCAVFLNRSLFFSFLLAACAPAAREIRPATEYGADLERPASPQNVPSSATSETATSEKVGELPSAQAQPELSPPTVERKLEQLDSFYDAVDALRRGERDTSVRILWLGDSHTAADFMTHPLREHLARLGGDGGPGFIRLGLDGYRHGAAHVKSFGRWRKAPILPAQRTRVLDGVFGYGGIRALPAAAAGVTASVRAPKGQELVWTLSTRLLHGAKLDMQLGETKKRVALDEVGMVAGGGQFIQLAGADKEELSVHHVAGDPQVFGVFADYTTPGIVLDTVGINGARTATPLAWEPEQYVELVRDRSPDLLVLAFGTNEVFDQTRPDRYIEHNIQLVELVRQARPGVACWIVGPPDSSTKEGTSKARVAEVTAAQAAAADKLGCAFTSAFQLMGGEGSFNRWARAKPAKARGDRVHFTILGYRQLGELLAGALIGGVPLDEVKGSAEDLATSQEPTTPPASAGAPPSAASFPPPSDAPAEATEVPHAP